MQDTNRVVRLYPAQAPVAVAPALDPAQILRVDRILLHAIARADLESEDHAAIAPHLPAVHRLPRAADARPQAVDVIRRAQDQRRTRVEYRDRRRRALHARRREQELRAVHRQALERHLPIVVDAVRVFEVRAQLGRERRIDVRPRELVRAVGIRGVEGADGERRAVRSGRAPEGDAEEFGGVVEC